MLIFRFFLALTREEKSFENSKISELFDFDKAEKQPSRAESENKIRQKQTKTSFFSHPNKKLHE